MIITTGLGLIASFVQPKTNTPYMSFVIYSITCLAAFASLSYPSHIVVDPFIKLSDHSTSFAGYAYLTALLVGPALWRDRYEHKQEAYMLILASLCGFHILLFTNHLMLLYLGLELISLPLYTLVGLSSSALKSEAAFKYYLQGVLLSAVFLFGASILYGLTGSLDLSVMLGDNDKGLLLLNTLGTSLTISIIFFKLGLVPYHSWVADVYEEAQPSLIVYLAIIPKLASIVILAKVLNASSWSLTSILIAMILLSSVVGNFAAYQQNSLQRLLGYASLAQMSFAVAPLCVDATLTDYSFIYLTVYCLGLGAVLWGIHPLQTQSKCNLENLHQLFILAPARAWVLVMGLLSLAGIPPFPGFFPKLMIVFKLVEHNCLILAGPLLLLSIVSLGYYLNVMGKIFDSKKIGHQKYLPF